MDELGSLLREAREAKGLTLAEAQEATRISSKFLEALEDGQYERLPTATHAKGYLRNYARYLDLEPQPLLDRFDLKRTRGAQVAPMQLDGDISSSKPIPPRQDRVFYDPVNMELSGGQSRDSGTVVRLIIIVALVIAVALIANRFIPLLTGNGDGSEALTNSIQEAVNSITNEEPAEATPTMDPALIPGAGEIITSTNRNNAIQLPTPTATRPTLPVTLDEIRLRLEITERTWMRVTIDDEIVFEGLARRDDEPYEWLAQQEAQLLTGNGAGIFVTINDVALGKIGGRGEVVEETWTVTGNG